MDRVLSRCRHDRHERPEDGKCGQRGSGGRPEESFSRYPQPRPDPGQSLGSEDHGSAQEQEPCRGQAENGQDMGANWPAEMDQHTPNFRGGEGVWAMLRNPQTSREPVAVFLRGSVFQAAGRSGPGVFRHRPPCTGGRASFP